MAQNRNANVQWRRGRGMFLWAVLLGVLVITVRSAMADGEYVLGGILASGTVLGLIWVMSRSFGWPFWPWKK